MSSNKSFHMKKLRFFRWLLMAALAASLPISAQAAGGRGMGGGPHFSGGRVFAFHDGRFHNPCLNQLQVDPPHTVGLMNALLGRHIKDKEGELRT
jgi:hypothetical protein